MNYGSLKNQLAKLKSYFKSYDKKFSIIIFEYGKKLKVGSTEFIHALSTIGTDNEHCIIKAIKDEIIIEYTGGGNMPQLINRIVDSDESYLKKYIISFYLEISVCIVILSQKKFDVQISNIIKTFAIKEIRLLHYNFLS